MAKPAESNKEKGKVPAKPAESNKEKGKTPVKKSQRQQAPDKANKSPHDVTPKDGGMELKPEKKHKKRSHKSSGHHKKRSHRGSKRSHKKKHKKKRRIINVHIVKAPTKDGVATPQQQPVQAAPTAPVDASDKKKKKSKSSSSSSSSSSDSKKKDDKKDDKKEEKKEEKASPAQQKNETWFSGLLYVPANDPSKNNAMVPAQQPVPVQQPVQPVAVQPAPPVVVAAPVVAQQPQKPPAVIAPKPTVPVAPKPVVAAPKPAIASPVVEQKPAAVADPNAAKPPVADPKVEKPPIKSPVVDQKPAAVADQKPPIADPKAEKPPVAASDTDAPKTEECKPKCDCADCDKKKAATKGSNFATLNEWTPFEIGAPFPTSKCVQALGRPLDTLAGESKDQFVAMAYVQGEPVMGRVWKDPQGKVAASFCRNGREFKTNVGTIEILLENSDKVRGFDYGWRDFSEASVIEDNKEWQPVHIGFISPCVMIVDGKEMLGKVDMKNERALVGHKGTEKVLLGTAVGTTKVLCRKAKPGFKLTD